MLTGLWNKLQGNGLFASRGKQAVSSGLLSGFLTASQPDLISNDHKFRDPTTGFLDSPPALRQLITYLRENHSRAFDARSAIFARKRSFLVGLDAQNLGSMNAILGRDRADQIWGIYMSDFVNFFSEELGKFSSLTGFRYGGDELIILVGADGLNENDVEQALEKTKRKLNTKFSAIGLNNLPSINPERPSGFSLHTASHEIWNDPMFVRDIESYRESVAGLSEGYRGTKSAHYHGPAIKLETLSKSLELRNVIDDLSKNKPEKDVSDKCISDDEFRMRYLDKIDKFIAEHDNSAAPAFTWPENLEMTTSMEGSRKAMDQNHRDFVAQARPNNVLLRFDLSGLKYLNQHLPHLQVEGILERLHETVEHPFMIGSGRYGESHAYESFDNGSGVIDIMIDADVWKSRREQSLRYVDEFLINTLNFHVLKSYLEDNQSKWSVGETYREKQERLLEDCNDENLKALFAKMNADFTFAEVPIIDDDPEITLENLDSAITEQKATNRMPAKPFVSMPTVVERPFELQ